MVSPVTSPGNSGPVDRVALPRVTPYSSSLPPAHWWAQLASLLSSWCCVASGSWFLGPWWSLLSVSLRQSINTTDSGARQESWSPPPLTRMGCEQVPSAHVCLFQPLVFNQRWGRRPMGSLKKKKACAWTSLPPLSEIGYLRWGLQGCLGACVSVCTLKRPLQQLLVGTGGWKALFWKKKVNLTVGCRRSPFWSPSGSRPLVEADHLADCWVGLWARVFGT